MTLEEAIKANEHLVIELNASGQDRLAKGVQLGIEALKREKAHREYYSMRDPELLLGETEK